MTYQISDRGERSQYHAAIISYYNNTM